MKNFADLTEREVLAVAISSEEEDSRIYMSFAEDLAERYPESAKIFEEMAEEETRPSPPAAGNVRAALRRAPAADPQRRRQGIPAPPADLADQEPVARHHPQGSRDDGTEAERFYIKAAEQAEDVGVRRLLGDLAEAEKGHEKTAARLTDQILTPGRARRRGQDPPADVRAAICPARPCRPDGRIGLDAGAAVRRRLCHPSELADVSGRPRRLDRRRHQHGICRGAVRRRLDDRPRFALAARRHLRHHDGARRSRPHHALSGAGRWPNAFWIATAIAGVVVFFELWAIAFIRARYMDTPFLQAVFQIVLGGVIVLGVGILIGAS